MLEANIVGLGFLIFLVLMLLEIPVAISLGLGGAVSLVLSGLPLDIIPQRIFVALDSFPMLAIPLFIFVGQSMNTAGITDKIFDFAQKLVGRVRGGLAHVNILASIVFAGMSGAAVADASGIGKVEIKAMTDQGYDKPFSAAVTAASSTIGPIIPPSIPMVIYGFMAEVSIGRLFLGGFLPGLLMAILMMIYVAYVAKKRNYPRMAGTSFKALFKSFVLAAPALFAPILMLGGISFGVFSPTEGAAVTALYVLILGFFIYRELKPEALVENLKITARSSATILLITSVAALYSWLVSVAQIPQLISDGLLAITNNKYLIFLLINIALLFTGCFMEGIAAMTVFLPIMLPIITRLGMSPVHFGVVMVLNLMIGLVTPPVGLCLFIMAGETKLSVGRVIKETTPFLIPLLISLLLVTFIPEITLWLPNLIMGSL